MGTSGVANSLPAVQVSTPAGASASIQSPGLALQPANLNQNFQDFSLLPREIQNEVWRNSFKPRLIEWGAPTPAPAIFQADRASRDFGKRQYFFAHWAQDITNTSTYVHQQIDVIYWKQRSYRSSIPWWNIPLPPLWIGKIFHLAMDIISTGKYKDATTKAGWDTHSILWSEIQYRCPSLKILYIILEPIPSDNDTWEDLKPVNDSDNATSEEEQMIVSVLESAEARWANNEWVPELEFLGKKVKAVEMEDEGE